MKYYKGLNEDRPKKGGSYPAEKKFEVCSFLPVDEECYGYVQPASRKTNQVNLKRIDPKGSGPFLDDVLVIWVATSPKGGARIVGWYKSACVYKEPRELLNGSKYNIRAKAEDVVCIEEYERRFRIPQGTQSKGYWGFGQANVCYRYAVDGRDRMPVELLHELETYLNDVGSSEIKLVDSNDDRKMPHCGCGEGHEHKALKEYVLKHPELVGALTGEVGQAEYSLRSGDKLDVYFPASKIAVEVKSKISNDEDIERGLFQCVKYKATLDAMDKVDGITPQNKVVLVLGGKMEKPHKKVQKKLGITVIENVKPE